MTEEAPVTEGTDENPETNLALNKGFVDWMIEGIHNRWTSYNKGNEGNTLAQTDLPTHVNSVEMFPVFNDPNVIGYTLVAQVVVKRP